MTGPGAHEAHETPLANRIVEQNIRDWLNQQTAIAEAAAGSGDLNDYERGIHQGIDRMRHLYLDSYWYTVAPRIIDELRRAALLTEGTTT